jgi:hypothetical protein
VTDTDRQWVLNAIEVAQEDAHVGTPQTADECLILLRCLEATYEVIEERKAWAGNMRADADRLRRILADPELQTFLVDIEDRLIFGESVADMKRLFESEKN